MKISNKIVQIAAGAYRDGATHESAIRAALSAVLYKLMVKVKPLEWTKHPTASLWRAETAFGVYQYWGTVNIGWLFDGFSGEKIDPVNTSTEDQAKAAAQADYEHRLLEGLEIVKSDDDVAAVRKQAIEEAVTELEINWPHIATPEMRDAIRAISAEPVQGADGAI